MKICKKLIVSQNKKSGLNIWNLYSGKKYIYSFEKQKNSENYSITVYDKDLKIIYSTQNESFIFAESNERDEFYYFEEKILRLLFETNDTNLENVNIPVFELKDSEIFLLKLNLNKILIIEPFYEEFQYSLVGLKDRKVLWKKTFKNQINFIHKVEYKNFVLYIDQVLEIKRLECFNFQTGDLVWSHKVQDWFVYNGPFDIVYKNQVRQLVIYKHLVIANMQGHIVAFDIESGKETWRTDIGLVNPTILYFFILDEQEGLLWFITGVSGANKGKLKCLNALTGEITFEAKEFWAETGPPFPNKAYDRWFPHFSMNKNFIFLTFDGDAIAVMSKKTGEIVEWFSFSKRNWVTQMGHKLLNKTLYQATEFELLAIDVSEYFIDGDEYEKNAKDD